MDTAGAAPGLEPTEGIRRATLTVEVAEWRGAQIRGEGILMTVGFLHGQSAYEPEPGVPLDYVGHGFKRFSRD
jgi:hypothetical protein